MARSVGSALRAADPQRQDAGAVALARRYAALIDNAAPLAKYTRHLDGLRTALRTLDTLDALVAAEAWEHFDKIAEALSAHSVASDLGPKLLAALTSLGMTPAGRGAAKGGQNGTTAGPLDELRARARARRAGAHHTPPVDASA